MVMCRHAIGTGARDRLYRPVWNPREVILKIDVEVPVRGVVAHVVVRVAILLMLAGANRRFALCRHPSIRMVQAKVMAKLMLDRVVGEPTVEPQSSRADTGLAGPAIENRVEADNIKIVIAVIVFCVKSHGRGAAMGKQFVVATFRLSLIPRHRFGHPQYLRHQHRLDRKFSVRIVLKEFVGSFHRERYSVVVERVSLAVRKIDAYEQNTLFTCGPCQGGFPFSHCPKTHLRTEHLLSGDKLLLPSRSGFSGVEYPPMPCQR